MTYHGMTENEHGDTRVFFRHHARVLQHALCELTEGIDVTAPAFTQTVPNCVHIKQIRSSITLKQYA